MIHLYRLELQDVIQERNKSITTPLVQVPSLEDLVQIIDESFDVMVVLDGSFDLLGTLISWHIVGRTIVR